MAGSVLIVDDNVALAENLGEILALANLDVVVESDPIRALARAHELSLSFVVLDIHMPRMDGLTLHRHLLELHPNANFVLMTAQAIPVDAAQSIRAGARVLEKPIDLDEFLRLACESSGVRPPPRESSGLRLRAARESSGSCLRAARESSAPLLRAARESSGPRLVVVRESSAPHLLAARESSGHLAAARRGLVRSFAAPSKPRD